MKTGNAPEIVSRDIEIPTPPFWGTRVVTDIELNTVFEFLTESVLFHSRWGYQKGNLTREEYEELIEKIVKPEFEALKLRCREEHLLQPLVIYGYFQCNSAGEEVIIFEPDTERELTRFHFPRQKKAPYRSIADYILPMESGKRDVLPLQIATVGKIASQESQRLYQKNAYKEYLLFHGFSVETAEALAEYWHQQIRLELKIAVNNRADIKDLVAQKYRGKRFSFGYPTCPDLSENRKLLQLLDSSRIGVSVTAGEQMIPEQTTSAIIIHHPQAKYFSLE
jgi:5-methyltetrahydrofolate--homocysteine methyltransferase